MTTKTAKDYEDWYLLLIFEPHSIDGLQHGLVGSELDE